MSLVCSTRPRPCVSATPRPPCPATSGPGCLSSGEQAGVGPGPPANTRKDGAWGWNTLPTPCFGTEATSTCDSGHTGTCSPPSSCCGFPCGRGEAGSSLDTATMLMWQNSPTAMGQGLLRVGVRAARLGSHLGSSVVPPGMLLDWHMETLGRSEPHNTTH